MSKTGYWELPVIPNNGFVIRVTLPGQSARWWDDLSKELVRPRYKGTRSNTHHPHTLLAAIVRVKFENAVVEVETLEIIPRARS